MLHNVLLVQVLGGLNMYFDKSQYKWRSVHAFAGRATFVLGVGAAALSLATNWATAAFGYPLLVLGAISTRNGGEISSF